MATTFAVPAISRAQTCYEATIVSPSPFMGNNGEIFKLSDGSIWEVKYEYEYLYEYLPAAIICPKSGKLAVKGKTLNVERVTRAPGLATQSNDDGWTLFEETNLSGSITGIVQQGRIFKTTSGNIYEVVGLTLQLVLALQPRTMILRQGTNYKLVVEGFNEPLLCKKLN